jgi:hypothetical protein
LNLGCHDSGRGVAVDDVSVVSAICSGCAID